MENNNLDNYFNDSKENLEFENNSNFQKNQNNVQISSINNDIESNKSDRRDSSLKSNKSTLENNLNESFVEYLIKDENSKKHLGNDHVGNDNSDIDPNINESEVDNNEEIENMGFCDKILQQKLYNFRPKINKRSASFFIIPVQ